LAVWSASSESDDFGALATAAFAFAPADCSALCTLAIQALWGSVLVLSGDFSDLLNYMGGAGSLFGELGIAAVFVMRFRHPQALRPYRVWGYPWIPTAHLLGSLAIFVDLPMVKTRYSVFGLVIVSCAIPFISGGDGQPRSSGPAILKLRLDSGPLLRQLIIRDCLTTRR
jgi:hypothetical protein